MLLHKDRVPSTFIRNETQNAAHYRGLHLGSAFQPIVSLSHRRVIGYEALLRAVGTDGAPVPPTDVFALSDSTGESVELDRRCRSLHLRRFPPPYQ